MKLVTSLLSIFVAAATHAADRPATKPGFQKQILDVTYGEVWRPNGWFYSWSTTASGAIWTVAKEDPSKGWYDTGMRVQLIMLPTTERVTAEQVAQGFIQQKTASATVVRRCEMKERGGFKTVCLETKEQTNPASKLHRILYSISWSEERRWVVVNTFGAPDVEWEALRPTVDAMTEIVLIGEKFHAQRQ